MAEMISTEAQELAQQTPATNSAEESASVNPTDQDSNDQASVSAGDTENKPVAKSSKKAPDYSPGYTDEQKTELEAVTKTVREEISHVIGDPKYGAVAYADGANAVVDIREVVRNGIHLAAAEVNREHGTDEAKTGASIMKFGPQHPILIITIPMAKAAGIEVKHFDNDPNQSHVFTDEDFVLLDGHGRINFLLSIKLEDWPAIYGIFPSPDHDGYYNLRSQMAEININISKWSASNLVQKRLLEEGTLAHQGWALVHALLKAGYNYQAACEAVTLDTDRIKASDVNTGDSKAIFSNYNHAVKIHEALVKKFDEGILKTKVFPAEISSLWKSLVGKAGNDFATEHMLDFISGIPQSIVAAINTAKKTTGGASKDEARKKFIDDAFKDYCDKNNIEL